MICKRCGKELGWGSEYILLSKTRFNQPFHNCISFPYDFNSPLTIDQQQSAHIEREREAEEKKEERLIRPRSRPAAFDQ